MKETYENEEFRDKEIVVLVNGRNVFNEQIYCYLKTPLKNFPIIKERLEKKEQFDLREYGSVVAAGTGEPSEEIKEEMRTLYDMIPIDTKPAFDPRAITFDDVDEGDLPF
jgi:hypothetical protein